MIVIKDGPEFSKIYADKAFDKWGEPTKDDIRVVEQRYEFDIRNDADKIDAKITNDIKYNHYKNVRENTLSIIDNEMRK